MYKRGSKCKVLLIARTTTSVVNRG